MIEINNLYIKLLTAISITGALLVSLGAPLYASILWSFTNPLLAHHNYKINQKEQSLFFVVCAVIAWLGVANLWFMR